jgi:RimJ/RimL family protein N-acetyltransferase
MSTPEPRAYEIRVAGHLDDHWSSWFGGQAVSRRDDGTTTLSGPVADQAQLHGVLAGLRDVGATILELRAADGSAEHASGLRPQPAIDRRLQTERLTLRPATAADADATWTYRRLESVNEWLSGSPEDLEDYRAFFSDPARLARTVVAQIGHEPDGDVIGDLMVRREDAWAQSALLEQARGAQVELGWVLDPAHTGRGYASEAVRELLRCCFEDLGVHRVIAVCFADNVPSWRLMERLGMRREAYTVRDSLHRSGRWLDCVTYAMVVDEWKP